MNKLTHLGFVKTNVGTYELPTKNGMLVVCESHTTAELWNVTPKLEECLYSWEKEIGNKQHVANLISFVLDYDRTQNPEQTNSKFAVVIEAKDSKRLNLFLSKKDIYESVSGTNMLIHARPDSSDLITLTANSKLALRYILGLMRELDLIKVRVSTHAINNKDIASMQCQHNIIEYAYSALLYTELHPLVLLRLAENHKIDLISVHDYTGYYAESVNHYLVLARTHTSLNALLESVRGDSKLRIDTIFKPLDLACFNAM